MKWLSADDKNVHVSSSNVVCDGTHGGCGYGDRMQMAPGSWSLRQAKPSHLHHTVHVAAIQADVCSWFC